ncbi:MAG: phosphoribosylformylglycinamidine synthase subunit PurQ [Actinomycetota bacterium]
MTAPRVLIPVALGTNRDGDLADAFEAAGAQAERVPLEALRDGEHQLADFQILAVPGGFSYGDALGAGRLFGLDLVGWFGDQLRAAHEQQMPMIGICNGFQALVRAGLLPGDQPAVLTDNERGRFECRWVELGPEPGNDSIWLSDLDEPIRCPIAHAEGRFVAEAADALEARGGVALRYLVDGQPAEGSYPANPNGSARDIAGVTDPTGRVLGLMPHPENHVFARQDIQRSRRTGGQTLGLFAAAVRAVC